MRIITGKYKGKKLIAGDDFLIRPTTDRVKEYIFQVLSDIVRDSKCADIFSGSGNLGLEALSRGAEHISFIEKAHSSVKILEQNIKSFNLDSSLYTILHTSAENFIRDNTTAFDLYLLDPPFKIDGLQDLIDTLSTSTYFRVGDLIVLEHEVSNPVHETSNNYTVLKQKKMGRSIIKFIEKRSI